MHLDLSRNTYGPNNHYLRVPQEQGRILLDADANEQTAIVLERLQKLAMCLFGEHWGPQLGTAKNPQTGFAVAWKDNKLTIGGGSYFVHGWLCENGEFDSIAATDFYKQQDYPIVPGKSPLPKSPFLVYIDVWERLLVDAGYPEMRDPGLESIPASPRTKLVWQVKTSEGLSVSEDGKNVIAVNGKDKTSLDSLKGGGAESVNAIHILLGFQPGNGTLKAQPTKPVVTGGCDPTPSQAYRGLENQLYRVEIHRGGNLFAAIKPNAHNNTPTAYATFKWSRDNGSVCFGIKSWIAPTVSLKDAGTPVQVKVELTQAGLDDRTQLKAGRWVEYVDEATALLHLPTTLFQVKEVDPFDPRKITLEAPNAACAAQPDLPGGVERRAFLRLWDQEPESSASAGDALDAAGLPVQADDNALVVVAAKSNTDWLELGDGIQIQFSGSSFKAGDYWLIPARYGTGGILWPTDNGAPKQLPPITTEHGYAPLLLVKGAAATDVDDCRRVVKADLTQAIS